MDKFRKVYSPYLNELISKCYNYQEFGCSKEIPQDIKDILEEICSISYKMGQHIGEEIGYEKGHEDGILETVKIW